MKLKLKKLISIILMTSIFALGTSTYAKAETTCKEVLTKCDKALNDAKEVIDAKDKEIQLYDLALKQSSEYSSDLNIQLKDKEEQLSSPLRNPFIMSAVGLVLGVLAVTFAKK